MLLLRVRVETAHAHHVCAENSRIMPALCSLLLKTNYAQNYASIIFAPLAGVAYSIHNTMNTISKHIVKKRIHPGVSVHYPFQSLLAFYIFSYLSLSLQQVPSTPCFPCSNDYTPLIIKINERAGVYGTVATTPGKKKRTSVPVGGRADSAGLYQSLVMISGLD